MVSVESIKIAVLIPCRNEAATVANVVESFRRELPESNIYVYDNKSEDGTATVALESGAIVRRESLQGKGYTVCRMFADIDANVYVMVDGDSTYDAESAGVMIDHLISHRCDMVTGTRTDNEQEAYRFGHRFGNRLLTGIVRSVFKFELKDMLSGYRVFSRRFVKSFPMDVEGFELETMLAIHAYEMRMNTAEIPTKYASRPEGSVSKLSTLGDGWRILNVIGLLVKELRPLTFFAVVSLLLLVTSLGLGVPVINEFAQTGVVLRFPTAILSASIMIIAVVSLFIGITLNSVAMSRREAKRLAYLSIPWLGEVIGEGQKKSLE
jgi:glycosyltransferase involved in cell wall biosynthesis